MWLITTTGAAIAACTLLPFALPAVVDIACLGIIMSAVVFAPAVVTAFLRRQRVASVLQNYPWNEVPYEVLPHNAGNPTLVTIIFRDDYTPTFRVFPFPVTFDGPRIWFAGDARYGGVVSPIGGHAPVRVVPHRMPAGHWGGGNGGEPDALAVRVGLVRRRSGKGTQT
ncbi:hypothetical protein [Streptomyces sp. NPDC089799]|uniref:hypothetical protein n=1 Tax=Streptomyces sp. NPDC089799 TaxID=3155066 RepID=UPI0034144FF1